MRFNAGILFGVPVFHFDICSFILIPAMEDKLKFEEKEEEEVISESDEEVISESNADSMENEDEIAYITKRETLLNNILEKMIGKLNDTDSN